MLLRLPKEPSPFIFNLKMKITRDMKQSTDQQLPQFTQALCVIRLRFQSFVAKSNYLISFRLLLSLVVVC